RVEGLADHVPEQALDRLREDFRARLHLHEFDARRRLAQQLAPLLITRILIGVFRQRGELRAHAPCSGSTDTQEAIDIAEIERGGITERRTDENVVRPEVSELLL